MKKVIISRGRADSMTTHKFIRDFVLVCPESQVEDYSEVVDSKLIVPTPDDILGLSMLRNWVLDHFKDKVLIMFDDDITGIASLMKSAKSKYITDLDYIDQVIENCANNAQEAGSHLFGFNQSPDVRRYQNNLPFSLTTWVGCVIGFVGRKHRFDEKNKVKVDIDYCLQTFKDQRFIWVDLRYTFKQTRDTDKGGSSIFRTKDTLAKEMDYLKLKWRKNIRIRMAKTKESISLNIKRKQRLDI